MNYLVRLRLLEVFSKLPIELIPYMHFSRPRPKLSLRLPQKPPERPMRDPGTGVWIIHQRHCCLAEETNWTLLA